MEHAEAVGRGERAEYGKGHGKEIVDRIVERDLSPFEELYDVNPELFANMPTSQFIDLARGLEKIDKELHSPDREIADMGTWDDKLQRCLDDEQGLSGWDWDNIDKLFTRTLSTYSWRLRERGETETADSERRALDKAYKEVGADSFNKSTRQQLESLKQVVSDLRTKMGSLADLPRRQRAEFLDKYRPGNTQ
jgi:hypothetical protein